MILWDKDYATTNELLEKYGSPLFVYSKDILLKQIQKYNQAFSKLTFPVQNMFAVKALPNPTIMKILQNNKMGFDCSSLPEIELAKQINSKNMFFTSNNTTINEFTQAYNQNAIINFDSFELVEKFIVNKDKILTKTTASDSSKNTTNPKSPELAKSHKLPEFPEILYLRYNPGDIDLGTDSQAIMGLPTEAKFGMTKTQIFKAATLLKSQGVKRVGLHTMLVTNEQNFRYMVKIIKKIFDLAIEVSIKTGVTIDSINLGGGIGVPYHPEDPEFEICDYAACLQEQYNACGLNKLSKTQNHTISIYTELGRYITAECGFLLTKVLNKKVTYRNYVGVDATMSNLMRPGMYGAYHFIKVLSGRYDFSTKVRETVDIVGALCENNDKFAIQRSLPITKEGDILVIHTAGAHSSCMGFQYNGRLRCAEILLDDVVVVKKEADEMVNVNNEANANNAILIRRAETNEDYFATLKF